MLYHLCLDKHGNFPIYRTLARRATRPGEHLMEVQLTLIAEERRRLF